MSRISLYNHEGYRDPTAYAALNSAEKAISIAKRERSERLIAVCKEVRDGVRREIVERGDALSIILETYDGEGYTAHADNFAEVRVASDDANLGGKMVKAIPVSHKDGIITAKML